MPLRHVPPHPAGNPLGRRVDEGWEATMSETRSASAIARSLKNGISDVNRREFLAMVAAAQGAFILGFCVPQQANAQSGPRPVWYEDSATPEVNAWIVISPDETVTIRIGQTELGQGVWTSDAMMVAEELRCDWSRVRPRYASANRDAREKAP